MIQFKSLRQYTHVVPGIRYPINPKAPFLLIYFSENSTLLEDYSKLNLMRIDARIVVVPITKFPRTRMTAELQKQYRKLGLYAYGTNMKTPSNQNIIYDTTPFLHTIDKKFKAKNYRQRAGSFIKSVLQNAISKYPPNYQKVLIYSIDVTKNLSSFVNRKSFPLIQQLREEDINYDHLILNVIDENSSRYRLLVKDKDYKFSKIYYFMKNIQTISTGDEEKEVDINDATEKVVKKVSNNISDKNESKIRKAVTNFLSKDKKSLEKVTADIASDEELEDIASASIMYNVSGNIEKSKIIAKSINPEKKKVALKVLDKSLSDELLEKQKTVSLSSDVVAEKFDIPNAIDNKSPEHLFRKRQVDFETNLRKDVTNSFKVLERKDIPLKVNKVILEDVKAKKNELDQSDVSILKTTLTDKSGRVHNIEIEVPKIDPVSGTFRVNGRKKCLINQIVLNPISFLKQYDSKFESSYSAFHIKSRRLKKGNYLEVYMGSSKLPLFVVLSFSFGLENVMRSYGFSYKITTDKPKKDELFTKIDDKKYIIFEKIDNELKRELCQSFIFANVSKYKIKEEFGSKEYFGKLITEITGRIDSTYRITNNLENIVDPISRQVLINKQLPYQLFDIMKYMSTKVIQGYKQDRNDISNQRVKGSEVLVHLAQKQILAAYTEYKEQVLSGNKEAKFTIPSKKLISDFVLTEIVTDMEYANPMEEMSTLTRVSPVGKSVGGIPDKEAIQAEGRNVHPSYFGNIDPVDTPEGGNIGIIQQLTVDAFLTSARGLINTKKMSNNEGSGALSTSLSMVPFFENNEGARHQMAANQSRQMIPLKNPEPPAVQSGYESILTNVLSDNFIKRSPCDGKVLDITEDFITIKCKSGKVEEVDITPSHLRSGSGKNTLSVFKSKVKKGQTVKEKQILAEGACMSNGSISMGRTLLTAVMPYRGYNFEDGIVINERVLNNDKLTSLHGIIEEVLISKDDRITFIVEPGSKTKKGDPLIRKTIGEIEQLIGYDEDDESSDVTAGQFIKKSPGGTVVDIEVFCNVNESKFPNLKNLIQRTRKRYGTSSKEKFTIRGETIKGVLIKFKIEQELRAGLADKMCNRYGAKGIISLVEKDSNMPRTPWGETIDIIVNPIGIIARMNVGQLYELYCGLISRNLALNIVKLNDHKKATDLLKRVLPILDKTKNQNFSSKFITKFSSMNSNEFKNLVDKMSKGRFFPIIIPPFKAPGQKEIMKALKELNLKTGYKLTLPEYNVKTQKEVPVGYMYFAKLEHIGEEKLHGRSTGPVTAKTMQPTSGKRREGGQRMGEAETLVLAGYNCPNLLSEFLGPLSDDVSTKNKIIADVIQNGEAEFREPTVTPAKDLLNSYFISLMLGK